MVISDIFLTVCPSQLTSELDMTLPIFDTSSKQQKDGTGELPIYVEATTSSCLTSSFFFCLAAH